GLEISNNTTPFQFTNIWASTYQTVTFGSVFNARKARGTTAAPTAVQNGDTLAVFEGDGYGSTHFGTGGSMTVRASEPWTDTAHGSTMEFATTNGGTSTPAVAMTIQPRARGG